MMDLSRAAIAKIVVHNGKLFIFEVNQVNLTPFFDAIKQLYAASIYSSSWLPCRGSLSHMLTC